ncbi:MAG: chemotaxis protein CheR [Betaproteobacteria bacterium]|nr:chemotaxis protein CheR [Betaproteobacteria bacterium]
MQSVPNNAKNAVTSRPDRALVAKGGATPAASGSEREFEYRPEDFDTIAKLIYKRAGIQLSAVKADMVYSRLARRLRALGHTRFSQYLAALQRDAESPEWEAFTNALTTNLTSFFREAHHFPILSEHLLRHRGRDLSIWCCAASTGEEPYSIAMTCVETFGRFDVPVRIVASDLDTNVLEKAREGVYPEERLDKMDAERRQRFFMRGKGRQAGFVRVRPELTRLIEFRQVNLLSAPLPLQGPYDVIFCRNVLIYFDKATQADVVRRLAHLLRPDGLLFVGHSESLFHVSDVLRLLGKTVYEPVKAGGRRVA